METFGEAITEFVNTWDPIKEADARSCGKFLQGLLAGTAANGEYLKIDTIETPRNCDGDYEDFFVVVTASGHRLRVTVEPETEPKL